MECKQIVTGVHHEVRGRKSVDSFFVIDAHEYDSELLKFVRDCYVDDFSLSELHHWIMGDLPHCTLLVSLDLKFAIFRRSPARFEFLLRDGEKLLPCPGNLFPGFRKSDLAFLVSSEIEEFPELWERYGFKPPRRAIPQRVDPSKDTERRSITGLDSQIREAYRHPDKGEADGLIMAFLCRDNRWVEVAESEHVAVESKLKELTRSGLLWSGGYLRLYDTNGLTIQELRARRRRAIKNSDKLLSRFPFSFDAQHLDVDIEKWLSGFDLDELLEMVVVTWYRLSSPGGFLKSCVMYTDRRLFGNDFD